MKNFSPKLAGFTLILLSVVASLCAERCADLLAQARIDSTGVRWGTHALAAFNAIFGIWIASRKSLARNQSATSAPALALPIDPQPRLVYPARAKVKISPTGLGSGNLHPASQIDATVVKW